MIQPHHHKTPHPLKSKPVENSYYKYRDPDTTDLVESIDQQDDNMSSDEDLDNLYQNKLQLYKPHVIQMYNQHRIAKQKIDEGMIVLSLFKCCVQF